MTSATHNLGNECGNYLSYLAQSDHRIWVLDGDLADSEGAELFFAAHPQRSVMAGIAEQSLVSVSAGLAACGKRPWVFSFAAFLVYRALDQIRTSVSQTRLPVTLFGGHAGGCCGRNGKTHQALSDIATISGLPEIKIWSPCDRYSLNVAIDACLANDKPNYVRVPRKPLPDICGNSAEPISILTHGSDVSIIATGLATHWAMEVHATLAESGVYATVIHANRLIPFPKDELETLVSSLTSPIFTLEDHRVTGGLGAMCVHNFPEKVFHRMGWPDDWQGGSGTEDALRALCALDVNSIVKNILTMLDGQRG